MPSNKRIAALLIAVMTVSSADISRAGLFDWWRTPQTVNYVPTGVYQNGGPAAAYYTSNYAPQPVNYGAQPMNYAPAVTRETGFNTVYRAPLNGYAAPTTTFYRAPRTTYYRAPTTTFYRAATPNTSYYAPISSYAPPATTTNYAPVTAYRPVTAYQPVTSYRPVTAYQPITAYQPVQQPVQPAPRRSWFGGLFRWGTPCDGTSPCRPYTAMGANYANPRTNFRPVWQRVPVTYYRPVSSVDPVTGQSVQRMQPCTTYRWQIQQRPAMFPQRTQNVAPQGVPCEPTMAAPPAATSGGTVRSDDPYYNRSRIIQPDRGGLIPKDAEILRDERVPADERPRLNGTPREPETSALDRANTRPTASTREPQANEPTPAARPGMMLDPRGDANPPQAPPLLSPQDKTAARPLSSVQRVAYQASWPRTKPSVRRATLPRVDANVETSRSAAPTRKLIRRQPTRRLDDSGWRSLRD